ncbi:MAG: FecR family protein [Thalassotalea sp.]
MNISIKTKLVTSTLLILAFTQSSYAVDIAGKTMVARGQVEAKSMDDSSARALKRRSEVFANDVVTTGANSKTQLRMTDGGMIALKENSELIISQYKLNANGEKGSVVLDLVEGGLRSITGAIKADNGDYQLNTSIASIGIRGTHYEVQMLDGVLWLAVWDGAIDVTMDIGSNAGSVLSLGAGEGYSYGNIDINGNFNTFIEPPKVFKQGLSSDLSEQGGIVNNRPGKGFTKKSLSAENQPEQAQQSLMVSQLFNDIEKEQQLVIVHDNLQSHGGQSIYDLVTAREGSINYGDATFSSEHNLTNFSAGMDINFDSGEISNGQLSFDDDKNNGKWNAVFNGNMNITKDNVFLEVDVTSASHGNNVADGDISAKFIDASGLDALVGDFELYEVSADGRGNTESDVSVDGSYQVKRK